MTSDSFVMRTMCLAAVALACACEHDPSGPDYNPQLPEAWAASVDNVFFPLTPGTTWRYEYDSDEGLELTVVEVVPETRLVHGAVATIVYDAVYLNDVLIEDTRDYYAQDLEGNVWYLGEDSKSYENGKVVSTEGSWEWDVDGALPGVIMWANPGEHLNVDYRQEYYRGEAEDWARVVGTGRQVTVPAGTFTGCIETEDWNGLESGSLENKFYCPQIGFVLEVMTQEGGGRAELVAMSKTAATPQSIAKQ